MGAPTPQTSSFQTGLLTLDKQLNPCTVLVKKATHLSHVSHTKLPMLCADVSAGQLSHAKLPVFCASFPAEQ